MKIIRRPAFLLLEVMIALFLVSLCLIPLINPHYAMIQSDLTILEEGKLERIAARLYSQFLIQLYRGDVLWTDIGHIYDDNQKQISIPPKELEGLPYDGHYVLRIAPYDKKRGGEYSKPLKDPKIHHLLEITYTFTPQVTTFRQTKTFTFRVYTQKLAPPTPPTTPAEKPEKPEKP